MSDHQTTCDFLTSFLSSVTSVVEEEEKAAVAAAAAAPPTAEKVAQVDDAPEAGEVVGRDRQERRIEQVRQRPEGEEGKEEVKVDEKGEEKVEGRFFLKQKLCFLGLGDVSSKKKPSRSPPVCIHCKS